ncbi:hypothetical protein NHQ30_001270 [Ciborinia camelliae]|nr:hypothetical protein NHQ30_001270 [Ciborinia camelliae]
MDLRESRHIHRADLQRGLLEAATAEGCEIHMNSHVVHIDPSLPEVFTERGETYTADLIIASDADIETMGLKSMAREVVTGRPSKPIPTGQMAYRVTLSTNKLEGIPELKDIISTPRNNHWLGPNGTILSYLLKGKGENLLNLVFTCDANMPDGIDDRMQDSTELRARFQDWNPRYLQS